MKKYLTLIVILIIGFSFLSCKGESKVKNPVITIEFENYDSIVIELYPDVAPNTVNNFIYLVKQGYYDGLIFHRVIENFMIQGGQGTTQSCKIKGEFADNGFTNNLKHERGVISMARTAVNDSATSQFFIMHADNDYLDGKYAAFGKMLSGFETLDAIATTKTDRYDQPIVDQVIKSITVETYGVDYPDPKCV